MVIVNLMLRSFLSRIREKFLKLDLDSLGDVDEAATALSRRRCRHVSGDENALVDGLETNEFVNRSSLFYSEQALAKRLRQLKIILMLTHLTWAAHEIAHTNSEWCLLDYRHIKSLQLRG